MHSVAIILFTVLHVHLDVSDQDFMDVSTALQQACPYTNFCNRNARRYLQNGRRTPCCRECSCLDDCLKRDNCCPDKISNGENGYLKLKRAKTPFSRKAALG